MARPKQKNRTVNAKSQFIQQFPLLNVVPRHVFATVPFLNALAGNVDPLY